MSQMAGKYFVNPIELMPAHIVMSVCPVQINK